MTAVLETDLNSVLALGNFDGVHRGHLVMLDAAARLAETLHKPWGVLTFSPHPRQLLVPDAPPFRLTDDATRESLLIGAGAQFVHALPFTPALAAMEAAAFEAEILVKHLQIAGAVAGASFRYGRDRGGTMESLARAGAAHGFAVEAISLATDPAGGIYSSSRIREALKGGRLDEASHILGRRWHISYTVVKGDQRGRTLGFPTANGAFGELLCPAYGIYAVKIALEGETTRRDGVASIGIRPMWETPAPLVETHIFDFDGDIYGQRISIQPVRFLRPELKFTSLEGLTAQIGADCLNARHVLEQEWS